MTKPEDSGLYQLVLYLPRKSRIRIGRLGTFDLTPGYYIYTGSARRGLSSRVHRHLSRVKKRFWHIDFLLAKAKIIDIKIFRDLIISECGLAQRTASRRGARILALGFGASDCRCESHLAFFQRKVDLPVV